MVTETGTRDSLQRPLRRHYRRNQVVVAGIDDQWDADLMDMTKFSKENDGVRFVLLVIDIFSKYLWMQPLKDKKGPTAARALEDILREGRQPTKLRTDKGQEFRSKALNNVLADHNIQHFYSQNTEVKASYAERAIKTIKTKMNRYMTFKKYQRYFDRLQNSLGIRTRCTTALLTPNLNWLDQTTTKCAYLYFCCERRSRASKQSGISRISSIFDRIFTVLRRFLRNGIPVYSRTTMTKPLRRHSINRNSKKWMLLLLETRIRLRLKKILKTHGRGPSMQHFVKWLHWPKKFNPWINADDMAA
ncbi:uncharacterized protein LOC134262084 [Saccostrea cucullata]|uniref:uncharacterized protein LOC134262084 n=1 Tax=Saccostrea cuccullata TaxID=36930 RepID=UPI002ED60C2B